MYIMFPFLFTYHMASSHTLLPHTEPSLVGQTFAACAEREKECLVTLDGRRQNVGGTNQIGERSITFCIGHMIRTDANEKSSRFVS